MYDCWLVFFLIIRNIFEDEENLRQGEGIGSKESLKNKGFEFYIFLRNYLFKNFYKMIKFLQVVWLFCIKFFVDMIMCVWIL